MAQECESRYQPEGWEIAHRFVALRYTKKVKTDQPEQLEQDPLFDTPEYTYRVFVTSLDGPVWERVSFYNGRAGAENLIKEANNDAA